MNPPAVRNLVLTTSSGFTASQLDLFLRTFEKTRQPSSRMVVFLNRSPLIRFGKSRPLTAATEQFVRQHSDDVVGFKCASFRMRRPACLLWPVYKRIFPRLKTEEEKRRLTIKVVSLFFLRFVLYLEYLESLPEKPGLVFLTDCRDVIFQDDVFSRVTEPGLYCFLEGKGKTIESSPENTAMVRSCFGDEAVREIGACEISCAGTVLGDYTSICSYLQGMAAHARTVRHMQMISGDDQGLHNYLVHKRLVPGVRLTENSTGPVGTLGQMTMVEIKRSPENMVLQSDGRPYAVLHQYDRHAALVASHPFCQPNGI